GVGILAAVNAVFPEHRRSLVTALDAAHVHGLSKALVAPLAFGLVVAARSLGRGSRRAWEIALVLLALLLFLNVERRFQEGASSPVWSSSRCLRAGPTSTSAATPTRSRGSSCTPPSRPPSCSRTGS